MTLMESAKIIDTSVYFLILSACGSIVIYEAWKAFDRHYRIQPSGTNLKIVSLMDVEPFPVITICEKIDGVFPDIRFNPEALAKCNITSGWDYLGGHWAGNCSDPYALHQEATLGLEEFILVANSETHHGFKTSLLTEEIVEPVYNAKISQCYSFKFPKSLVKADIRWIQFVLTKPAKIYFHIHGNFLHHAQYQSIYQEFFPGKLYNIDYNFELLKMKQIRHKPCNDSLKYDRGKCYVDKMRNGIMEDVGCIPPYLGFKDNICTNRTLGKMANKLFWNPKLEEWWCDYNCYYLLFNVGMKRESEKNCPNSCLYNGTQVSDIWLSFDQMEFKFTEEQYLYGFSSMVAEIGGYVGMFLGMSVMQFSNLFSLLARRFLKMKEKVRMYPMVMNK